MFLKFLIRLFLRNTSFESGRKISWFPGAMYILAESNFSNNLFSKFDLCLSSNSDTKKYLKKLGAKNVFYSSP